MTNLLRVRCKNKLGGLSYCKFILEDIWKFPQLDVIFLDKLHKFYASNGQLINNQSVCYVNTYGSLPQAVHVAAQYGKTAFLNHIVAKYQADFEAPDNEGRSPLHWYDKKL